MGGFGSGRWGGRPTIEATTSYVLTASILKRVPPCGRGSISARWPDGFHITVAYDTTDSADASVELRHVTRAGAGNPISYRVYLARSYPPYGGGRWWFVCPRYQRRVFKLYLPLGGHQFWSRGAYGLGYACQRGTPLDRAHRRKSKIERAFWWDGDEPVRAPRMWQRTFERKLLAWERAGARVDAAWLPGASRLLSKLRGRGRRQR